jgi:hypothetical protein
MEKIKIHLKSRNGTYRVAAYNENKIWLETNHYNLCVPATDFKTLAGGNENFMVSKSLIEDFINTVQPDKQAELKAKEEEILQLLEAQRITEELNAALELQMREEEARYREEEAKALEYERAMQEMWEDPDYESYYRQAENEIDSLRAHNLNMARKVYSNFNPTAADITKPIKFIVQTDNVGNYRVRFDYYGFVFNFHSSLSNIFSDDKWCTTNGGWIKVINDVIYLYGKSGDYGVFDGRIALKCTEELFPNHIIFSQPGIDLDRLF